MIEFIGLDDEAATLQEAAREQGRRRCASGERLPRQIASNAMTFSAIRSAVTNAPGLRQLKEYQIDTCAMP
jgi:hypothetical protein